MPSAKKHVISCVPVSKETLPRIRVSKLMPDGHGKCCKCGLVATHVMTYTIGEHPAVYSNIFGGKRMFTADHILPRALGGCDAKSNLQLMCAKCNHKKGMIPTEAEINLVIQNRKKHIRPGFTISNQRYIVQKYPQLARIYDLSGQEEGPAEPFKKLKNRVLPNFESRMQRVTRLSGGLVPNKHPHHPMWGWARIFDRFPELKSHVLFG